MAPFGELGSDLLYEGGKKRKKRGEKGEKEERGRRRGSEARLGAHLI